jgi:hypothetical protein
MANDTTTQRVEVTFVGPPPMRQIARASGVTDVEVEGRTVRCIVYGSFQPFLDAVRGYEIISLMSSQPEREAKQIYPAAGKKRTTRERTAETMKQATRKKLGTTDLFDLRGSAKQRETTLRRQGNQRPVVMVET